MNKVFLAIGALGGVAAALTHSRPVAAVAAGVGHSIVLGSGLLLTCGANKPSQLGDGSRLNRARSLLRPAAAVANATR